MIGSLIWAGFLLWSMSVSTSDETPYLMIAWRVFWSVVTMALLLWGYGVAFIVINCLLAAGQIGQVGAFILVAPPPLARDMGTTLVMTALRMVVSLAVWGIT